VALFVVDVVILQVGVAVKLPEREPVPEFEILIEKLAVCEVLIETVGVKVRDAEKDGCEVNV
jgi:hypothetical protein